MHYEASGGHKPLPLGLEEVERDMDQDLLSGPTKPTRPRATLSASDHTSIGGRTLG